MRTKSIFLALGLCLLLLSSHAASAQVNVRIGGGYYAPPRAYYGPRYYYPPRPAVVYAVPPRPVVVVPAPYYAPRPVYYAPRPYYGYRGRGHHGRRW
ncbi:MAG: hypothetical protein JWR44_2926 [Hymenobacter sp.]|jgi:hypothetical protein|nr:hypothetical protein [Hymenobacter sp.]